MSFKFQNFDFLHLDSSFSEDELLVRRTARDFVEDNIVPHHRRVLPRGPFPARTGAGMGEMVLRSQSRRLRLRRMSNVEYGLVTQELERGDSGLRSFVSVQSALVMYPIYTFGSEEQKNTWLPALASGEKLGCFASPSQASGRIREDDTTARKSGDEYILNGERCGSPRAPSPMWPSSGPRWRTMKTRNQHNKVRGFLVRPTAPAFPRRTCTASGLCAHPSRAACFAGCAYSGEESLAADGGLKSRSCA